MATTAKPATKSEILANIATATELSIQHTKTRPYSHRIIASATQPSTY